MKAVQGPFRSSQGQGFVALGSNFQGRDLGRLLPSPSLTPTCSTQISELFEPINPEPLAKPQTPNLTPNKTEAPQPQDARTTWWAARLRPGASALPVVPRPGKCAGRRFLKHVICQKDPKAQRGREGPYVQVLVPIATSTTRITSISSTSQARSLTVAALVMASNIIDYYVNVHVLLLRRSVK